MSLRHNIIGYALEALPRPGSRETRVKKPLATQMKNRKGTCDAEEE